MKTRIVQPEILDSLPPDDPRALRNHRDLDLLNRLMGNDRWFRRSVFPQIVLEDHVLELGPGRGRLATIFRRIHSSPKTCYSAIDRSPRPPGWPSEFQWRSLDVMSLRSFTPATVLIGNFIMHQFGDEALRELGARINSGTIRMIAFNEPTRSFVHLWLFRALGPLLNDVTRHDGDVSIRAGFRGEELPCHLGLGAGWTVRVNHSVFGSYRLLAQRRENPGA